MILRIPCSYETLGITIKFNACQIGQLHLKWSKCCPALPEAWAPANAGAHAEPLYNLSLFGHRLCTRPFNCKYVQGFQICM